MGHRALLRPRPARPLHPLEAARWLAGALLVPLSNLVSTGSQLQLLGSYVERIDDVFDTPPERAPARPGQPAQLQGGIELDRVSFRYAPTSPLVVKDVSVKIDPGQFVAIVGRSGARKTTLANLLLGLYLPTSGRVLYDDDEASPQQPPRLPRRHPCL